MSPKEETETDVNTAILFASSLPVPVLRFLYLYRFNALRRLKDLHGEIAELCRFENRNTASGVEQQRRMRIRLKESETLSSRLERIERYLGHPKIDPRIETAIESLEYAKLFRFLVQIGSSDEALAAYWRNTLPSKSSRGRPVGTMNCDGYALRALALLEANPKVWSYPKLADVLLGCKAHKSHIDISSCTVKLKKAAERLRRFLKELGYQPTVT